METKRAALSHMASTAHTHTHTALICTGWAPQGHRGAEGWKHGYIHFSVQPHASGQTGQDEVISLWQGSNTLSPGLESPCAAERPWSSRGIAGLCIFPLKPLAGADDLRAGETRLGRNDGAVWVRPRPPTQTSVGISRRPGGWVGGTVGALPGSPLWPAHRTQPAP